MKKPDSSCILTTDEKCLYLKGSMRNGGPPSLLKKILKAVEEKKSQTINVDMSGVTVLDSLGASVLAEVDVQCRLKGKSIKLIEATEDVDHALGQYYYPAPEIKQTIEKSMAMVSLGDKTINLFKSIGDLILLLSESVWWTIVGLWNPHGHRKGSIPAQALAIGVGALPVVLVVAFLVGVVLTLQSAAQLRQFGANIFVADLVVISMTREMAPLMTAIMLAGRSGAAIAAEISSMKVNEEVDALVTMGLKPIRYIVVPKLIGIVITAPLLTIMATVVGIFGGFLVAISTLDLTPQAFFLEAQSALYRWDIITGQLKSIVFAWLIVTFAAFFGFRVTGGPEGVGRATTKAVVASIFAVIVADSVLGLLFYL